MRFDSIHDDAIYQNTLGRVMPWPNLQKRRGGESIDCCLEFLIFYSGWYKAEGSALRANKTAEISNLWIWKSLDGSQIRNPAATGKLIKTGPRIRRKFISLSLPVVEKFISPARFAMGRALRAL